jgi:hypothetical protein
MIAAWDYPRLRIELQCESIAFCFRARFAPLKADDHPSFGNWDIREEALTSNTRCRVVQFVKRKMAEGFKACVTH